MAVMSSQERNRVFAHVNRSTSREMGSLVGVTKSDIANAVAAMDDWIEANQSVINSAFPIVTRTNLTLQQKTLLFCYVAMRRAGMLRIDEDNT
jgi:hypothetical protein